MSRLNQLIRELCPNGVELKAISEIGTLTRGKRFVHADSTVEGIPCIHYGEIYTFYGIYTKSVKSHIREELCHKMRYAQKNDVIIVGAGENNIDIGVGVAYLGNTPVAVHDACYILKHKENPIYISYCLRTSEYHQKLKKYVSKGKICSISAESVGKMTIPIPPVEIQNEIVSILNNLTELTTKLTTELTAELRARKKQYQYYLNNYFEQQTDNIVPLGNIGSLTRGKRFVHADATEKGVPCIHYGELYTYYGVHADSIKSHIREELRSKMRYAHNGDVIIVGAGENNIDIGVGVAWEGNYDVAVHDACYILHHEQNPKYISYFLRSDMYHSQIKKYVSEGKICAISAAGLGKALIPIPDIEEQNRIVAILEWFDILCNDIAAGITAEVDARKKQYEYYRDKILKFEEG